MTEARETYYVTQAERRLSAISPVNTAGYSSPIRIPIKGSEYWLGSKALKLMVRP